MSTKNLDKNETKYKAMNTRQCKEISIQTFALIITHVQMLRKNVREFCFIQIVPFC